jgi:excisionase family DNA binding protein
MSRKNSKAVKDVKPGPAHPQTAGGDDSQRCALSNDKPERLTVSVEYAAGVLGISRAAAYNYAKDGKLPVIRLGSRIVIPRAALDKLLQGTAA